MAYSALSMDAIQVVVRLLLRKELYFFKMKNVLLGISIGVGVSVASGFLFAQSIEPVQDITATATLVQEPVAQIALQKIDPLTGEKTKYTLEELQLLELKKISDKLDNLYLLLWRKSK